MDVLRRVVNAVGVVRRDVDRRDALEAEFEVLGISVEVAETDVVLLLLPGAAIEYAEAAFAIGKRGDCSFCCLFVSYWREDLPLAGSKKRSRIAVSAIDQR